MSDDSRTRRSQRESGWADVWERWSRRRRDGAEAGPRANAKEEVEPADLLRLFPPDADAGIPASPRSEERSGRGPAPRPREPREGVALLTVCTVNHLHFARTMVRSFQAHHPGTAAYVVVADAAEGEALEVPGAHVLSGREVAPDDLPYLALKLDACNLCCALKPFALLEVAAVANARTLLYLDSDILVCAPFRALLERLQEADFVLTPHLLAPYEFRDRTWQRPSMGDIAAAGFLNGGVLGIRHGEAALRFLEEWRSLVASPGAFDARLGPQHEQNSLNFVTSFAERVGVLRDPSYNVAYWNLHERGLRWKGLDEGGDPRAWTVDGEPLVCFHFSGFLPSDPTRLSHHDSRHGIYHLPSVAALATHYCDELERSGAAEFSLLPYRFARLPSGLAIDPRLRKVFVEHERDLRCDLDPWTTAGEIHYCRAALSPVPHVTGLLPAIVAQVVRDRGDLAHSHPHARVRPAGLMRWFYKHGVHETGLGELVDRHRPASVSVAGSDSLAGALVYIPAAFEGLERPLGRDRAELLRRLAAGGHSQLVEDISTGIVEHWRLSTLQSIRALVDERPDLRDAFPDLLDRDAEAFARWIADEGVHRFGLPADAAERFLACARGRSLARVFCFLSRHPFLQPHFPLAMVGVRREAFADALVNALWSGVEFDLDDLVAYLWVMDEQPWAGLPLLFELPEHLRKTPSPRLPEGQDAILPPELRFEPRFAAALAAYRRRFENEAARREERYVRRFEGVPQQAAGTVFRHVAWQGAGPSGHASEAAAARARQALAEAGLQLVPGVNLFGYQRSSIGLGTMTRGVAGALERCGLPVAYSVLGGVGMDRDLGPDELFGRYELRYDCNLFVSYPHLEEDLLARLPAHARAGRRNVVYLAWEQRDGHPWWSRVYGEYDQVWALSDFAARHLSRHLGREVVTMPCALDFESFPPAARKADVGLPPREFVFLYTFDAASSIERKNPEAAIRAFRLAFRPDEPVRLLLRVANAERLETRDRLRRVVETARGDARIEFRYDRLSRADALRVVSAADAVVSLHRAEGFGFLCAEAMAYGRPVVATGYSGNLQFMTPENSCLVAAREIEVAVGEGPFQRGSVWAEPALEPAAEAMRRLYDDRSFGSALGERARREVRESLSVEAAARRVAAALGLPAPSPRRPTPSAVLSS